MLLGAPTYTPVGILIRGAVGVSSMEVRLLKGKINYLKNTFDKQGTTVRNIRRVPQENYKE